MRLYRFSDLVGNSTTVNLLQRSLKNKSLKNFIIMSGMMGSGKSTCAEIVGLYLTCEEPQSGEPCLKCSTCTQNLKALSTTGTSTNLVKKNLGSHSGKKDINDLIKEVFMLMGSVGNNVYILEEAHSLSHNDQTPLLEELDRLSENSYVIICTTRPYKLLPELRSRAISYNFNRLNKSESKLLFDKTCERLGVKKVSKAVENMIIKYSKGVPRDLVNLVEFVHSNSPTDEEVRQFLGFISNETFLELFISMKEDIRSMSVFVEDLLMTNSLDILIAQFKEFMVNCMFMLEGGVGEEFGAKEKKQILDILNTDVIYKISKVVERMNPFEYTESDFKLDMIRLHQIFKSKRMSDILAEDKQNASNQKLQAMDAFEEEKRVRQGSQEIKRLTKEELLNKLK